MKNSTLPIHHSDDFGVKQLRPSQLHDDDDDFDYKCLVEQQQRQRLRLHENRRVWATMTKMFDGMMMMMSVNVDLKSFRMLFDYHCYLDMVEESKVVIETPWKLLMTMST